MTDRIKEAFEAYWDKWNGRVLPVRSDFFRAGAEWALAEAAGLARSALGRCPHCEEIVNFDALARSVAALAEERKGTTDGR